MQIRLNQISTFVVGVLIGFGSVAIVLFSDISTVLNPSTTRATIKQGTESSSVSNSQTSIHTNPIDIYSDTPSRSDQIVFPKQTFYRKVSVLSWVADLTEDEVVNWLEHSTKTSWYVPPSNKFDLQTILLQKLSIDDPDRALTFLLKRDPQQRELFLQVVFDIWATTDLYSTIERAKELTHQELHTVLRTIVNSRDDLSFEGIREIGAKIGDENFAISSYFLRLTTESIKDSKDIWYEIVDLANREDLQDLAGYPLSLVAAAWLEDDGVEVLDEIVSSISSESKYSSLINQILRGASVSQPEATFSFILSHLSERAPEIIQRSGVSSNWARKDPKGMLVQVETLPPGNFRQQLVRRAIREWAKQNPRHTLEQLDVIPLSERDYARMHSIEVLTQSAPTEAAQYVLQVTDESAREQLAQSLVRQWVSFDAKSANKWVLSLPSNERMRTSLIYVLSSSLVASDPRAAFELALDLPMVESVTGSNVKIGYEVSILEQVAYKNVQIAIELLPQVREGSRVHAFATVGSALIRRGDTGQALGLANQMSEKEQHLFYQGIAKSWMRYDPSALLSAFDNFPSSSKSKVAVSLVFADLVSNSYSDKEIAHIENHITEEDQRLLRRLQEIDRSNPSPEDLEDLKLLYSW